MHANNLLITAQTGIRNQKFADAGVRSNEKKRVLRAGVPYPLSQQQQQQQQILLKIGK